MADAVGQLRRVSGRGLAGGHRRGHRAARPHGRLAGRPVRRGSRLPARASACSSTQRHTGAPGRHAVAAARAPATTRACCNFWRGALADLRPMPPVEVETGPILENVLEGDDIDLEKFPVPIWHPRRRRPLHRHGQHEHPRGPGLGLGQRRHLPQPDLQPRQHGHLHQPGQARQADPREVLRPRRAVPDRGRRGRRPAALHGRPAPRASPYGQSEFDWAGGVRGAADRGRPGQAHRPAASRPTPRSPSKAGSTPTSATTRAPTASGWATTRQRRAPDAGHPRGRPSTTATTRSSSAARRASRRTRTTASSPTSSRR